MDSYTTELLILIYSGELEFKSFIEFLALKVGFKNVVRLVVNETTYLIIDNLCKRHGITCLKSDFGLKLSFSTNLLDSFYEITTSDCQDSDCFVIFCGSKNSVSEACVIERDGCNSDETARIYGYPKCCAQNYQRIQDGEHWIIPYLTNVSAPGPYSWMNNKLAYLFQPHLTIFPDYFPCSIDCLETHRLASKYSTSMENLGLGSLLKIVKNSLTLPILVHGGYIYQFSNLALQSEGYINCGNITTLSYANGDPAKLPLNIQKISSNPSGILTIVTNEGHMSLDLCPGSTDFLVFK